MKKLTCLLFAVMMVLSCASCGAKEPPQQVDLSAVAAETIASIDSDAVILLEESNAEFIESLYPGLTTMETKQLVVYLPPVVGFACELVMVEAAQEADVETIRAILQTRVDAASNDTTYPENAAGWKNGAVVSVNGSYVVLAALPEGVEMPAAFRAEF